MLYDEEKREERDQFYRRGDYAPSNPDLAVENVGHGPMSTETQLLMMTRVCIKLQEQNKALVEILKVMTDHACEMYPHFESERGQREIAAARAAIAAAKE